MRRGTNSPDHELTWDGRSVWWPREFALIPGGDSNLWMCAQDVGLEIWSQFDRLERQPSTRGNESVRLENCSAELQSILIDALPDNDHEDTLIGAIMHFAQMVTQEFVLEGTVAYEARGGWDRSEDSPLLRAAGLVHLPAESLCRVGPWLFQLVPRKETDADGARVIPLNRERVVLFRPPRYAHRTLTRMRSALPLLSRSERDWMDRVRRGENWEDFKRVTRSYSTELARLTAPIGWNARGLFRPHIADFHWALRQLRWYRFCISARDSVLATLAEVFATIGSWRGEAPRLVWSGLPTIQQVEEGEARMMAGGVRFDEALRPLSG